MFLHASPSLSPAQWKVHVRRPGVIALQNEQSPENWLAIRDGKAIGNVSSSAVASCVWTLPGAPDTTYKSTTDLLSVSHSPCLSLSLSHPLMVPG